RACLDRRNDVTATACAGVAISRKLACNCAMFDWDDLRIFLAAARAGSLAAAGQRLGIDTPTVGRRIARLETALRSTLLVRSRAGVQLTAAGAHLLESGVVAEAAMERAGRVAQPDVVAGTVRISAAEGFGTAVLAPALPALAAQRPGLRIELAAASAILSASRREGDIALRLNAPGAPPLGVGPPARSPRAPPRAARPPPRPRLPPPPPG